MSAPEELVVLLDEHGDEIGSAPKASVHHEDTPLHLAFSCYVFDETGRLLMTRRALDKPTFPGVWTNSVCGHPAPGEDIFEAVRRRAAHELGLRLHELRLVVPDFRYQATMPNGVRENELCPVFTAMASGDAAPDRSEVAAVEWIPWDSLRDEVLGGERSVSAWCALQVAELAERETTDRVPTAMRIPPAAVGDLPAAALRHLREQGCGE
jgi:isopentenyl-diphosphate delta-isomerase